MRDGMLTINLGPELFAAAREYAAASDRELSGIIREALAKRIGRKDLAQSVKRGRPKKREGK
ncbi:MAG: hypothetical protein KGL39_26245 [Patescibacteria group bacterium]|nr:hypothetical protein [Patescibacteria group bacterium]